MKNIDESQLIRKKLAGAAQSPMRAYRELTEGPDASWGRFALYETLTCLLGPLPGGAGLFLRKQFYPLLFKRVGRGLIIGRNVVIRHPRRIELGDHVTIDDNCLLDGRGAGAAGLVLEDNVIVNRNCMLQCKAGPIRLGRRASVGGNSVLVSLAGLDIGEAVLTGAGCCLSAGAYHFAETDKAVMDQGAYTKGPIEVGANAWLGTSVIVLDGVSIGRGAVIGAGAVVTKNIPDYAIAAGVPARIIRIRDP